MKSASIGGESKVSKSSSSSSTGDRPKTSSERSNAADQRQKQSNTNTGNIQAKIASAATVQRDSRASIRDDPFFRIYQTVQSARMAEQIRPESANLSENASKSGQYPSVNLAILGGQGVGKSTFIQKALDLRQIPTVRASAKKMSLDDVIYVVRLIEIQIDDIVFSGKGRVSWPSTVDGQPMPSIDGIMVLYDVTNRRSVQNFQNILRMLSIITTQPRRARCKQSAVEPTTQASYGALHAIAEVIGRRIADTIVAGTFSANDKPCVLVSCKCDNPPKARQIEAGMIEEMGRSCGVETYQTSANVPESQKRCISVLLRAIVVESSESPHKPSSSSRAVPVNKPLISESLPSKSKKSGKPDIDRTVKGKGKELPTPSPLSPISRISGRSVPPHSKGDPVQFTHSFSTSEWEPPHPPGSPTSYLLDSALRPSTADTEDSQVYSTFLNMDDDDQSEILPDNMSVSQQSTADLASLRITEKEQVETGTSFDELVDRLLSLPMSKAEGKFVPIFLCLYRKFSPPHQLLSAVLGRFERVEKSGEAQLIRVGEQLRYLQVIAQWTNEYPGDFAHALTRNEIIAFVAKLERSRIFTYAAKEVNNYLENVVVDDDTTWAFHDGDDEDASKQSMISASSTTLASTKSKHSLDDSIKDSGIGSKEDLADTSSRNSTVPSMVSALDRSMSSSSQSLATLMSHDEAAREAQHLNPNPRRRLDKNVWRQFMAMPGEEIAKELTRIDWIMYSSIRPRDLVRHVSLTGDKKDRTKSLENVNRMINHFNHIALFVSSMILFRDKPKHRALALEKFMHIAWKLRQQNNYNSLGSVIAGINGTAIHRLSLTRELIPPQVQKEFMRLVILMGTGKSHFAYRLAWENSFSEKIPFLPLHRRDLVAAEDGNRTFVGPHGDRINWKKFEIMGDVIIEIQRSQERPYPYMQKNEECLRLILETKFLEGDEDSIDPYQELYERSVQVEPAGAGDSRKGFGWLRGTIARTS